jgi:predicted transposase/invertase (TIGR01784 family)
MPARYVNPFTDFGFKKIFGEEASKPLLLDFLNALLPADAQIATLSFKNSEHLGRSDVERKSVFDIYCESSSGEKFIVELQKAKQNFFKDRTVYYSTFPIREQAERGDWNYRLQAVYCIGILDFTFNDYENAVERGEVLHTITLKDQHGKVFYDKLTYIYVEMPNFRLSEHELQSRLDKWLYFIRHLEDFEAMPSMFRDEAIFATAFEKAEVAKLDTAQWEGYERSLREYRDIKGYIDTAFDEGKAEGRLEGILAMAQAMKTKGLSATDIADMTGLSASEIAGL